MAPAAGRIAHTTWREDRLSRGLETALQPPSSTHQHLALILGSVSLNGPTARFCFAYDGVMLVRRAWLQSGLPADGHIFDVQTPDDLAVCDPGRLRPKSERPFNPVLDFFAM